METDSNNKKSVLIVDADSAFVAKLAERSRSIGLEVFTARDVRGLSDVFDQGLPDLLMFDVKLMAGNSKTLIECLSAYDDTSEIPLILMCEDPVQNVLDLDAVNLGYHVHKCLDNWWRIEMFIYELVDLDPSLQGNNSSTN